MSLHHSVTNAGNRTSLNRAVPQTDVSCRKCGARKETLAHILGECIHTKAAVIRRHTEIRDLIMDKIMSNDKTAEVTKEPELQSEKGKLKPDLVVKNQSGVFVVDVTVRYEDGEYLKLAMKEKKDKYGLLLSAMQRERNVPTAEVLPIVVGTRGGHAG
ncbi:Retrovirus-related Pol polyprotein from type-1 retrotransposable element R2 [Zootermopsis nevadensis]|uniref:Retrovirus-related Pol polyprotein from type-1 retrotransposable element R2 n=1 Tax=Zootermopsis nevadensis TaxID=136037 RepID=A0A067RCF0_ZOONE|nr:Retrovirus-related Pol polyprotein from type-1 retrotransposable element R2 [Zootermopsis nevadensis]